MDLKFSIDRFEGAFVVLVAEDGRQVLFPRVILPGGAKPGELLTLSVVRDEAGTEMMKAETKQVQDELKARDHGGDIKL